MVFRRVAALSHLNFRQLRSFFWNSRLQNYKQVHLRLTLWQQEINALHGHISRPSLCLAVKDVYHLILSSHTV